MCGSVSDKKAFGSPCHAQVQDWCHIDLTNINVNRNILYCSQVSGFKFYSFYWHGMFEIYKYNRTPVTTSTNFWLFLLDHVMFVTCHLILILFCTFTVCLFRKHEGQWMWKKSKEKQCKTCMFHPKIVFWLIHDAWWVGWKVDIRIMICTMVRLKGGWGHSV